MRKSTILVATCLALLLASAALAAPKRKVMVNFDGVPLVKVAKTISKLTGKNFVVPDKLRNHRITIVSSSPVTPEEAYQGFLIALETEHLRVEEDGKFFKIVHSRRTGLRDGPDRPSRRTCGITEGIREIEDGVWGISVDAVSKIFEDASCLAMQARIVPSFKNGEANGFKLFAIRPSSLYSQLGLRNGDVIHSINGQEITSPDKALEVYTKLQGAKEVKLTISRRGQSKALTYRVE